MFDNCLEESQNDKVYLINKASALVAGIRNYHKGNAKHALYRRLNVMHDALKQNPDAYTLTQICEYATAVAEVKPAYHLANYYLEEFLPKCCKSALTKSIDIQK